MATICHITKKHLLTLVALVMLAASAPAQEAATAVAPEVHWRVDYNAARIEAQKKCLPLVVDFGTEHCYWCKRLDVTTFRDALVVRMMNEKFIPLRIDAERDATLAQLLHIQAYPTLVIAGPDGKILETHEGYLDAAPYRELLNRARAALANPEWMIRDYQMAAKAIAGSDYTRAIALLRGLTEDRKERPVQVKARQLLADLEQQASGRLARAKQLSDKGQLPEAMDTLAELLRSFNGTKAASEANQLMGTLGGRQETDRSHQRARRAGELLVQAREDYRTQQFLCCMDRCEVLAASYGDLPEGEEARLLAAEIKNNPEWMQTACESLSERLGSMYLALAETWIKKGQPQQAAQYLERVVKTFPNTRQAEVARLRLNRIQSPVATPASATEATTFKRGQ
jgi:thioredoxin-like negative regulator of GroEL